MNMQHIHICFQQKLVKISGYEIEGEKGLEGKKKEKMRLYYNLKNKEVKIENMFI